MDPAVRGGGAVEVLFDAINRIGIDRSWDIIRWTTADNNCRARRVYDQVAVRTTWITYDMTPAVDGLAWLGRE